MVFTTQNILGTVILLTLATAAAAQSPSQRGYHLFKPVPKDKMRPLSADRPDATESPQTVDAGHVQIEMDIAIYLRDRADTFEDTLAFAFTNFKLGLTHNVDIQFVFSPYVRSETMVGGVKVTNESHSNLRIRTKINLWGNDGDKPTSFALIPLVKVPTNSSVGNDDFEFGLITPFATDLPNGWGLGAQLRFDALRDQTDGDYDLTFSQSIVFGHEIAGSLAGFVEFLSVFPGESGADWFGTLNVGLTYAVNDDVQLDVGTFLGVNSAAPDFVVFVGITWRF